MQLSHTALPRNGVPPQRIVLSPYQRMQVKMWVGGREGGRVGGRVGGWVGGWGKALQCKAADP